MGECKTAKSRALPIALAILTAVTVALATNRWIPGGSGDNEVKQCDCGNIEGEVGAIESWDSEEGATGAGSAERAWIEWKSELGGAWDGEQYPHDSCDPQHTDESFYILWLKEGGSGLAPQNTVQVDTKFELLHEGSASPSDTEDPSWWWKPTVVVDQDDPVWQYRDDEENSWEAVPSGQIQVTNHEEPTYTSTNGAGQGGVPSGSIANPGRYRAAAIMPTLPIDGMVRILFEFDVFGVADSDNADVSDWKQGAKITIRSQTSSSSYTDTFDLFTGDDWIGD